MKAFPVSVEEIFALNRNNQDGYNFNQQIKKLVIPMYQREFKWQEDKVVGLVEDIIANKKFLGNILLDELLEENNNRYEIVDGQQRLTTAMLIVIAVYNLYGESESVDDQDDLIRRFKHNNELTLQNQTIGNFVVERARDATHKFLDISISDALDIYCQKKSFNDAYGWVINKLKKEPPINIEDFLAKFYDSQFVVIINTEHNNMTSIEQVFLDINFKSQLLDVEDIFKGYCFKNYKQPPYDDLKDDWVKIKKHSILFKNQFGYGDLGNYLYNYLLS